MLFVKVKPSKYGEYKEHDEVLIPLDMVNTVHISKELKDIVVLDDGFKVEPLIDGDFYKSVIDVHEDRLHMVYEFARGTK